ncbi:hypothetical protein M8J76_012143 [Diaphorina citri]|nr:hypothetical protein M8J76_012143 [Diaphorina citri]
MTERQSMMSFWHRPIEHSEAYDVCTLFIHIRGELDHLFRDQSTRIGTAWSRVANRMAEEGYPLPCANPGKRCNQKWRNLEKVYRKHSSYLAESTRIGTAWSRVANRMAEEGYPLPCANPGKRCNQKWRNLEKVYRKHSSYLAESTRIGTAWSRVANRMAEEGYPLPCANPGKRCNQKWRNLEKVYRKHSSYLAESTRIGTAWSRVANRMAEEGYPLPCANPGKRCNQKWRNLEKVYRKHSSYLAGRLPGTTGTAPIPTPQYFEEISSILGHSHAAHPVIQVDSLAPATVTTPAPSTVTSFHPLSSSTVASAPVVPPVPTPQPLRFVRLPSSLLQTLSQSQVLPSGPPPAFSPPPPPHSLESTFNMSPERPISSPSPPHFSHYIPISSLIRSHSPPPSPIHSHSSSLHSQIITRPAPTITRPPQTITRPLQTITCPPQAPRFPPAQPLPQLPPA